MPLYDPYGRHINYLRISVTDRCNLYCCYCLPRKNIKKLPHHEILRYEEIVHLVRIMAEMGIEKVRITGGEPLIRKNIIYLIKRLKKISNIKKICMTTNGTLLKEMATEIYQAGLRHINISLDTLNPKKYAYITKVNAFSHVWTGIMKALEIGFSPVKINIVLLRGINDDEILDFAKLTLNYPLHIRFIELMPLVYTYIDFNQAFISINEVKKILEKLGNLERIPSSNLDGPAQRFKLKGGIGEIGFIGALTQHFCNKCNRLRLTSDGKLRPCLFSNIEWDLKTPLRQGKDDNILKTIIKEAIIHKPKWHSYNKFNIHYPMVYIGG
ncbi:MAG: GTP 3',8-cyclase MoaA [Candidatus Desulfofervidus auxilii]|nr:GTP 3',8-cyclase MoaA [Candidatus Desulfofervidus auxilii]